MTGAMLRLIIEAERRTQDTERRRGSTTLSLRAQGQLVGVAIPVK